MKIFSLLFKENLIINVFLELVYIGISVTFFQKTFKIQFSRNNKFIYILTNTFCFLISNLIWGYIYSHILTFISSIMLFLYLLKISNLKTFTYFSLKSMILLNVYFFAFNTIYVTYSHISFYEIITFPIFEILSIIFLSIIGFIIYFATKHFNLNNLHLSSIEAKSNLIISVSILNLIITFFIFYKFFEIISQNFIYILTLDLYFYLSITNIIYSCRVSLTKHKIENLTLCNKTILSMYDETRAFKHDFHNIIQAIGGYIWTSDLDGLKKYYKEVSKDCHNTNNLSKLNPTVINNPAIYNILADKYYIASNNNIQFNLDVMLDLNNLNMKIYELTRILGILLDNAIEASKECTEKNINISFKQDKYKQILIIENTYNDKQLSIEKIFEKDYTTKPNNTGLGLWEVRKILNKNSNLNLHTSKNNDYFSQQLEIYTA